MRVKDLQQLAAECDIDLIGVTSAAPFSDLKESLSKRAEAGLYPPPFATRSLEDRLDPRRLLPKARSVIVAGVSYLYDQPASGESLGDRKENRFPVGQVSRYARGLDYHRVLRRKLECLRDRLKRSYPDYQYVIHIDNGPLLERAVAVRAGLGHYGKNCSLIHPEFGSWIFLGAIVTDLPFEDPGDETRTDVCGECKKCLAACPTGALQRGHLVDASRCLSYLTQAKGPLPPEARKLLGTCIFGCDRCQEVCPHNRRATAGNHREFAPIPRVGETLDLLELLSLSKSQFRRRFGPTAAGWRGKTVIQRNAIYALGNLQDQRAVPKLAQMLQDDVRPVIRGACAWALGQIGDRDATRALEKAASRETNPQVCEEIKRALDVVS